MSATGRALSPYLPPPGAQPPSVWGDEAYVRELFGPDESLVTARTESVRFEFAGLDEAVDFWLDTAGHVQAQRPRLVAEGAWPKPKDSLRATFAAWNEADKGVAVTSAYLLSVGTPGPQHAET